MLANLTNTPDEPYGVEFRRLQFDYLALAPRRVESVRRMLESVTPAVCPPDLIDSMRRALQQMAWSAALYGFPDISGNAVKTERALAAIQSGAIEVDGPVLRTLALALDELDACVIAERPTPVHAA